MTARQVGRRFIARGRQATTDSDAAVERQRVCRSSRTAGWLVLETGAVSFGKVHAWMPVRDLLRNWLGVGASTPETRVRLELKAQVAGLFGEHADEAYPFLANLLGLTLEPDAQQAIRELIERQPSRFLLRELAGLLGASPPAPTRLRAAAEAVADFLGGRGRDLVAAHQAAGQHHPHPRVARPMIERRGVGARRVIGPPP